MNLLTVVKGDPLSFSITHEVDDEIYELHDGEKYSFTISKNLNGEKCIYAKSVTQFFSVDISSLECGSYYFQIGIISSAGVETIISAATDTEGNRINTLIVTERI